MSLILNQRTMTCSACKVAKPEADFQPCRWAIGNGRCRPCMRKYQAAAKQKNPEKVRAYNRKYYEKNKAKCAKASASWERKNRVQRSASQRERRGRTGEKFKGDLRRRYGLSADEYTAILFAQGGGCAICGATTNRDGRRLVVDHCHKTGAVRGILCSRCNSGVGMLGDSAENVERASRYLARSESPRALVDPLCSGMSAGLVH